MQSHTPFTGETGRPEWADPAATGPEVRQSAELAAVVTGARRRALRDCDRQVDTAHLLHSLLEADFRVRGACGDPARLVRLFGYLAQRSIGYGLRWSGRVEDSGAVRAIRPGDGDREGASAPNWSPAAASAMEGALARARARGASVAEGLDLLAAIARDPESRAVEVLRRAGIDADLLVAGLDESQCQESSG